MESHILELSSWAKMKVCNHPEGSEAQENVQAAQIAQAALAQADVIQLPHQAPAHVWVASQLPAGVQAQLLQRRQACEGLQVLFG